MSETKETKKCKYCQSDIPVKAKVCAYCRRSQNKIIKWVIAIFLVILVIGLLSSNSDNSISRNSNVVLDEEFNAEDYETGITYQQLARTPNDYEDKKIKFSGTVVQVAERENKVIMRFAVDSNSSEIIFCEYEKKIVPVRILEDDEIVIYGISRGLYTYTSTLGNEITIPSAYVTKIEMQEEIKEIVDNESENNETDNSTSDETEEEKKEVEEVENMFEVGDIAETKNLKITFVSAQDYESDNQFIQPEDGNKYIRLEFEFENIGKNDEAISSMVGWNLYADDYSMKQQWIGDDSLDADLSPGKKVKGALYFEIPVESEKIVAEYDVDILSKTKIVFKVK